MCGERSVKKKVSQNAFGNTNKKKINAKEAFLVKKKKKSESETIESIINSLKHKSVAELAP